MSREAFTFAVISIVLALIPLCRANVQSFEVITYGGNSSAWNDALGLTAIRLGCSSAPRTCISEIASIAEDQAIDRVYLAPLLSVRSPQEMIEYSRLAASNDVLIQVGIDDFFAEYARLDNAVRNASEILDAAIDGLKSQESNLRFGITLYEDELEHELLRDPKLPRRIRAKVDDVHLYLHYRESARDYGDHVRKVKTLFPNAKVFAGSYAYDRIDYISCAVGTGEACTQEQEIELFEAALDMQMELVRNGKISGIEFYPAQFGSEESWRGWEKEGICRPEHRARCIETTLQMRKIVRSRIASMRQHRDDREHPDSRNN